MSHVEDLHEPNDREPGEPEQEPPLDLAEVEDAYKVVFPKVADLGRSGERLVAAIPLLIEELRDARQRIAEWEALPTREEWVVTGGPDFPTEPGGPPVWPDAGVIAYVARHEAAQLWRRLLLVRPYEPVDERGPF